MQSPFHRFQSADLRNAPSAGDTFHMKHHVERILGERRRARGSNPASKPNETNRAGTAST